MKTALVVNKIKSSIEENVKEILMYIQKSKEHNADLVIFPETAITGLCLTDDPLHDIHLGLATDSFEIKQICVAAKQNNINVALGLLERNNNELYDTALFIDRKGNIAFKYRRINKGWRDANQNTIYKEGREIGVLNSEFGKLSFLICGDLYDEELVNKVKEQGLDYLIFPFARSLVQGVNVKEKWENEVFKEYIDQAKKTGTTVLATNYLDEYCFGGAFVLDKEGDIVSYLEIQKEGILLTDL